MLTFTLHIAAEQVLSLNFLFDLPYNVMYDLKDTGTALVRHQTIFWFLYKENTQYNVKPHISSPKMIFLLTLKK